MLPLIPALLLIVLQGPAGVERMALDGRLPEALRALSTSARASVDPALARDGAEASLASLLGRAGSLELTRLIAKVLELVSDAGATPETPLADAMPPPRQSSPPSGELGSLREGIGRCARTRDGPFLS